MCATAALLSKESGMILPVLIGCFAWIYGAGTGREVSAMENGRGLFARAGAQRAQTIDNLLAGAAMRLADQERVFVEALA